MTPAMRSVLVLRSISLRPAVGEWRPFSTSLSRPECCEQQFLGRPARARASVDEGAERRNDVGDLLEPITTVSRPMAWAADANARRSEQGAPVMSLIRGGLQGQAKTSRGCVLETRLTARSSRAAPRSSRR